MCGIIGAWNYKENINTNVLLLRGRDGIGFFNNDKTIKNQTYNNKSKKTFISNSRAVPTTEFEQGAGQDINNQQPFENKQFVVVHNGILSNDKELIEKYNLNPVSTVDTAILPELFYKLGVINGLKELKGSFAILCYDKKNDKLYAAKNFMPLQIYKGNDKSIKIASIKEMFNKDEDTNEIPPYTCLEISRDNTIKEHSLYENKRNKKVLVICSGGTDSVTTAFIYKYYGYDVSLLHFKYGQAAEKAELYAVNKIAKILNAPLKVIDAKPIFGMFKNVSLLLKQKKANKKDKILDAESTLSYVPNRNALFTMIAAGIAEMNHIDNIAFGGQQMDSVYPDNNPTFVDAINNLLPYSLNWQTNIKFSAPLIHCMKHEIYQIGKFIGVPYEWVISCYYPKIINKKLVACNQCGCCQFRKGAMNMIGYKDVQSHTNDTKPSIKLIKNKKQFMDKYIKRWL